MIELRLWRSFVTVAEELNFRRAAGRLNISQPALTKQIQDLEKRLGVTLFRREAHGVEPTEATIACVEMARVLIDQALALEAACKAAMHSADTQIKLGMPELFFREFMPSVLTKVRAQYPDMKLSMIDLHSFETVGAVADGKVDLGFARAPVREQSVVAKTFRRGRWLLIMPASHKLAAKEELEPADLCEEPLIFIPRRFNPEVYDGIIGEIESAGGRVEVAYHTQDPMIGVELTANGIGHCLAASFALNELPEGLVSRPINGLGAEPALDLVWRREGMRPVLRALIDALLDTGADG